MDLDDGTDSEDEILRKFKDGPKKRGTSPRKGGRGPNSNIVGPPGGKPPYSEAGHLYGGSPSRLKQYKI